MGHSHDGDTPRTESSGQQLLRECRPSSDLSRCPYRHLVSSSLHSGVSRGGCCGHDLTRCDPFVDKASRVNWHVCRPTWSLTDTGAPKKMLSLITHPSHVKLVKSTFSFPSANCAEQDCNQKHRLGALLRSETEGRKNTSGFESAAKYKMCEKRPEPPKYRRRTCIHCRSKYCTHENRHLP